jgi:type IV fimbrial biogenesis protein FimT
MSTPSRAGATAAPAPRHARGLTLIEMMVALAVTAILASLALPSFASLLQRHRLAAVAEGLAADLTEARWQAAQSGQTWHLHFEAGTDWCYAVSRQPGCDCRQGDACAVKTVRASDFPGVALAQALDARFDAAAVAAQSGEVVWRNRAGDDELRVRVSPLGRASVCSSTGRRGYPGC